MASRTRWVLAGLTLVLAAGLPGAAGAALGGTDDTALFTTNVAPNVLIVQDNSGSMNNIVWHPDFDPTATYSCNPGTGGYTSQQFYTSNTSGSKCGTTRNYYVDPLTVSAGNPTRYDPRYLNWLHSLPDGDPRLADIASTNNGTYSACLQAQGYTTYSKYRRSRITAAQDVLREVVCNVNQAGKVRFGLAEFRLGGASNDPNGGFVRVPIHDIDTTTYTLNGYTGTQLQQLDRAIDALSADAWTPLGETLFQMYTYYMSRTASNRPQGLNGMTFPGYTYNTNTSGNYGSYTTTTSLIPPDPVQYSCQKNFVLIITDGEPTMDNFVPANLTDNTANGFTNFSGLIGDYNPDGEVEVQGADCVDPPANKCALYLDDIAKYMHEHDFRPDLTGNQTIDTYTVGFTTSTAANDLLSRTAAVGGGLFYHSDHPEDLATAIVATVTDIVQKSQSFTAATVPATRTADGGNFYTSLFVPSDSTPFWEGHLKLFQITSAGDILDANGQCALSNPSPPGECKSGSVSPDAVPFWDAASQMPTPDSRNLFTSLPVSGTPQRVGFDTGLTLEALGDPSITTDNLTTADIATYGGTAATNATTAEELADAIIENVRGCQMGTGVVNSCVTRSPLLGDIFHSNPLVVGPPHGFLSEPSYVNFRTSYEMRQKVVYAGANDGFLHAFDTGTWQPSASPPGYDRGTGAELFGFMPWPARRNIRYLPLDTGARDYYFVDGSPAAADVWFYPTPTTATKATNGSEWHTILVGGLRQGGDAYYGLDVTDPSSGSYPGYLWEFPAETDPASVQQYMGETWGTPIVTRIKVVIGGQPYERWVVIVTGGYDPSGDPNDSANYNANATAGRAIFVLDAQTGQILGEKKFDPVATDGQQDMKYAIASTPSVFDLNADGYADVIYVGDLGGQVWKWVIAYDPANGNYGVDPVNDATASTAQPNWHFGKFFQATPDATSPLGVTVGGVTYYKSIFFSPAGTLKNGKLWLAFGTGDRANLKQTGDSSTTADNNRFYAIQDPDPYDRSTPPNPVVDESTLLDATSDSSCADTSAYQGYYIVARDDEKFITNVELFSYYVITSSFTPTGSTDPCTAGGDATLYLFRVDCGQGYFSGPTDGTSRRLELGAGMPTDPKVSVSPDGTRVIVTQQDGEIENPAGPNGLGSSPGQLYWREVTTQ
jgi:type IV pilus assembly protein PilY1